jgi:hypothetical protein
MPSDQPQRNALKFLKGKLLNGYAFTKDDFGEATGWKDRTLDTYWSKQFKRFMVEKADGQFNVAESFRPYLAWSKFQQHVTQVRNPGAADYKKSEYEKVLIFEFFMPLTNESALKTTLDALFYRDVIIPKLRVNDGVDLRAAFPATEGEEEQVYFERICDWLNDYFVGYSMYQVAGRFRMEPLGTQDRAAYLQKNGRPYLADETTAVVRFIFPCETEDEVELIRFFFEALFIKSITQLVNAEAEIWMVESGSRSRVHVWRVERDNSAEPDEETDEVVPQPGPMAVLASVTGGLPL